MDACIIPKNLEVKEVENISQVWPNLELYMHGGVSLHPIKINLKS